MPDLYLGVLGPALQEIGHRWAMGELNIAEEHYATAVAQSILDGLSRRLHRAERDGRLAVVTGTPGEQHALGARMVADFLEADGWEVMLLGPGAPAADVVALVEHEQPDLVALSTATAGALDGVAEVLAALAALDPKPFIVAGGQFWTARTRVHGVRTRCRPRRTRPARARRRAPHPRSATWLSVVGPAVGASTHLDICPLVSRLSHL